MNDTSVEAFYSLGVKAYLQPKEAQIMRAFKDPAHTYTRQQLVDVVGMPLNAVCGRANSLIEKRALCVRGHHVDPHTRKRQELIGLPVVIQGALF